MKKFAVLVLGASLAAFPSIAAAADHSGDKQWKLDTRSQCWVFDPSPELHRVASWSGHACNSFDNEASGDGTLTWSRNGETLGVESGTMKKGKPDGAWRRSLADGRAEYTAWLNGQRVDGLTSVAADQPTPSPDQGASGGLAASSQSVGNSGDAYLETLKRQNRENCARAAQGANIVCNPQ